MVLPCGVHASTGAGLRLAHLILLPLQRIVAVGVVDKLVLFRLEKRLISFLIIAGIRKVPAPTSSGNY
jgi:hypothetical protein